MQPKDLVRKLTFQQMADLVLAMRNELKYRNPIFVNAYTGYLDQAVLALMEISNGEKGNPTIEHGPKEIKVRSRSK